MKEYIYKYKGEEYTWGELISLLITLDSQEEQKKKWWKRTYLNPYSFSVGFSQGMLYGVKLISDKNHNKLIEKKCSHNNTGEKK